jgi:hypothetical protein
MSVQPPQFIQPPPKKSKVKMIVFTLLAAILIAGLWWLQTNSDAKQVAPVTESAPAAATEPAPEAPTPLGSTASGNEAIKPPKK